MQTVRDEGRMWGKIKTRIETLEGKWERWRIRSIETEQQGIMAGHMHTHDEWISLPLLGR